MDAAAVAANDVVDDAPLSLVPLALAVAARLLLAGPGCCGRCSAPLAVFVVWVEEFMAGRNTHDERCAWSGERGGVGKTCRCIVYCVHRFYTLRIQLSGYLVVFVTFVTCLW